MLVEVVEHRAIVIVQRTFARRAFPILARSHESFPMLLHLGVLLPQRGALRVRFLPVAHPLGAFGLEFPLHQLEHRAHLLELEDRLLFERRRGFDFGTALPQAAHFIVQRALGLELGVATSFIAGEPIEGL